MLPGPPRLAGFAYSAWRPGTCWDESESDGEVVMVRVGVTVVEVVVVGPSH